MLDTVLSDLKVIDVTSMIAGPTMTRFFAELGANVIHVEPPRGDDGRNSGSAFLGREAPIFSATNRSKRGIVIDLKQERGRELLRNMTRDADLFVENALPGRMDALGLGYNDLRAINPRLVYVSITGWGDAGPFAHAPGYDVLIQAYVGAMRRPNAELPPQFNGSYIGDPTSPIVSAFAAMVALKRREQTGEGGHVTTSLLQAALDNISTRLVLAEAERELPPASGGGVTGGLGVFPCEGREYVVICAWNDAQFAKLCDISGLEHLSSDPQYQNRMGRVKDGAALNEIFGHWTSTFPRDVLLAKLHAAGIPCAPVRENGMAELLTDPQIMANDLLASVDHPTKGKLWLTGPAFQIDGERGAIRPAPLLGQHTCEILAEHGLSPDEIEELRAASVIA
jgi:crotonobetainyl-CoA:carnitine CoA-transferase CaiB-like acyl-CoA transferase